MVNLFLEEKIFIRFGIPKNITIDQASMFTSDELDEYLEEFAILKIHFTPYFAQANGQVEATNKFIAQGISKMVQNNPGTGTLFSITPLGHTKTRKKRAIGAWSRASIAS